MTASLSTEHSLGPDERTLVANIACYTQTVDVTLMHGGKQKLRDAVVPGSKSVVSVGRKAGIGVQLVGFYHPGNTSLSSASSFRDSPTSFNSVSYPCFCGYFLLFASPELSVAFVDSPSSRPLWYFLGALLLSRSQLRRQSFLVILTSSWLLLVASLSLCLLSLEETMLATQLTPARRSRSPSLIVSKRH